MTQTEKIAKEVQPLNEVIKQMQKRIVEGIWTIVNKVDTKKENKKEKVKF